METASGLTSELAAMAKLSEALDRLDDDARRRVIAWAADAYKVGLNPQQRPPAPSNLAIQSGGGDDLPGSFAKLIESANLPSNAERALVAAFWLQEGTGAESFDGRSINKLLKEHGIDVSNVTNALTSLISRKPRLAIQAGKKGKFEKLYRLTTEGRKAALALVSGSEEV